MSKENKDEVLESMFQKYNGDFNKDIQLFKSAYTDINNKYIKKILNIETKGKNKEEKLEMYLEYIKFEKYRLENNKVRIESNSNAVLASFAVLLIVIGITCLPSLYGYFGGKIEFFANVGIIFVFISLTLKTYKSMSKYPLQVSIYDLAINVLDDMENVLDDMEKGEPKQIKEHRRTDNSAMIAAKEKLRKYSKKRYYKKK